MVDQKGQRWKTFLCPFWSRKVWPERTLSFLYWPIWSTTPWPKRQILMVDVLFGQLAGWPERTTFFMDIDLPFWSGTMLTMKANFCDEHIFWPSWWVPCWPKRTAKRGRFSLAFLVNRRGDLPKSPTRLGCKMTDNLLTTYGTNLPHTSTSISWLLD